MTKLERLTVAAIKAFHNKEYGKVISVSHIYPRCYVLSRAASGCILVACPPQDAEPQIKKIKIHSDGGCTIRKFDDSLKAGDWCSVAYVNTASSGEKVAVKAVG